MPAISQRELLLEMRADLKQLQATVEAIARDQAAGVERRESMRRVADAFSTSLTDHGNRIDELERWRDRADGAAIMAKAAFGTSIVALIGMALSIANQIDPRLP